MIKTVTIREHIQQLETAECELMVFNAQTQDKLRQLLTDVDSPAVMEAKSRDKVKTLALRYCRDRIKLNSLRNCARANRKHNLDTKIDLVDEQLAKWGYLAISITKTMAEDYVDSFSKSGDTLLPAERAFYDACEQLVLLAGDDPEKVYMDARQQILSGADLSTEPAS